MTSPLIDVTEETIEQVANTSYEITFALFAIVLFVFIKSRKIKIEMPKQKDKVNEWYIIQEGTATLCYDFAEASLGPNSIIGILEQDWFICDYYASSDVTLLIFPCESVTDLKQFLSAQTKMRRVFLRSALVQRHQMLCLYAGLLHKIRQFQTMTDRIYNEYTVLCAKNKIESKTGLDVETMKPLEMAHKAENWEINNSNSLIRGAIEDYLNLMEQDEDLCIGSIIVANTNIC